MYWVGPKVRLDFSRTHYGTSALTTVLRLEGQQHSPDQACLCTTGKSRRAVERSKRWSSWEVEVLRKREDSVLETHDNQS